MMKGKKLSINIWISEKILWFKDMLIGLNIKHYSSWELTNMLV